MWGKKYCKNVNSSYMDIGLETSTRRLNFGLAIQLIMEYMYLSKNRYLYVFVIKGKYAYYYTYLDIKINFPFICCCCFQGSPTTFGSGQKIRITDDCTSSFIFTGTLDTLLDHCGNSCHQIVSTTYSIL